MASNTPEGFFLCEAREVCADTDCKGQIMALPIGEHSTSLLVTCEKILDPPKISGTEEYNAEQLLYDYRKGDDVARLYVAMDAPVCGSAESEDFTGKFILFNGNSTDY